MVQFIETVSDPHLQELLEVAIQGKGAFRRFKDTIARNHNERDRWYKFKTQRIRARVAEWLDNENIEAV